MQKSRIPSLLSRGTSKSMNSHLSSREEIKGRQVKYLTGMLDDYLSTRGFWGSVTTFKVHELSVSFLIEKDYDRFLASLSLRVNNAPLSSERTKQFFSEFDYNIATQMMGYIHYMFLTHPRLLENLSH